MASWLFEKADAAFNRTPFHIDCTVNHSPKSRLRYSPGAHRAGLQSDIQRQSAEAVISGYLSGLSQCQDFCMGRRVAF